MYLSIIILPLLGSFFSGFFGRKLGVKGAQLVTTSLVMITTLLAIVAFFEVGLNSIPVKRSEEHTSELQSRENLVCRLLLEKKKKAVRKQAHRGRDHPSHTPIEL